MKRDTKRRTLVDSQNEIPPAFGSEDEEREWWETHELSDAFLAENRQDTEIANLKFQQLKLAAAVDNLLAENRALKGRIEEVEAKLAAVKR